MEAITIDQILTRKPEQDIIRFSYTPYSMKMALEAFKKIGEHKAEKGEFDIDDDNSFVIQNLIRWAHGDSEMLSIDPWTKETIRGDLTKGIYIAGSTGTGKSLLLQILSTYLTIDNVRALFFGSTQRLLTYPTISTNKVCDLYKDSGDLYPFIETKVICFQDLGVEQQETLYMGTRAKVMHTIIQERGDSRGLITLFSSNNGIVDPDTLNLYGDRGVSRLGKMCNYFELYGEDRRMKKK